MTWLSDHWLDLLGWGGSALLVYSLLQASLLRLRILNAVACVILIVFNGLLQVWPMVGMNAVLVAINAWFVLKMLGERHDADAFEVLEVGPDDEYLRHVLRVHGADIRRFNPDFVHDPGGTHDAFLVQKGDETVGVVLLQEEGQVADVKLDYVTPRYRDHSPGEFVWRRSGLLAARGIRRVVTPPSMIGAYYERLGFRRDGRSWVLDVTP
ncbi:hypothetical protein [Nocardioides hwasunensis]|uniref:N-acetyltransferase domain-containing protein n=1 Tax=Nocardioides hwasunensis TaxID=397258 RepID=A0ABR8MB68_9ACTN|nr:hypothetical protein [Nocardioides hwasunensis]MBD3913385.1 hypothetical protein [Nocardioides hwasunensis]